MGTRHLIGVVLGGEYKVAQYGQWDGYFSGQGVDVCNFIQEEMDLRKFKKAVSECSFISEDRIKDYWNGCGADPNSDLVSMAIADKFNEKYPALSRDTGARVLSLIQNKGVRELQNSIDFAGDSLFCEYAYILNLDKKVLEIYTGFNTKPLSKKERFQSFKVEHEPLKSGNQYYPIKLLVSIPFRKATVEFMEELEKYQENMGDDTNE